MENATKDVQPKRLATSLLRTAWPDIVLLVLAVLLAGSGAYLKTLSEWTLRTDIRDYNKGVATCDDMLWAPLFSSEEELLTVYPHVIQQAGGSFAQVGAESTDLKLRSLAFYNSGTLTGGAAFFKEQLPNIDFGDAIFKLTDAVRDDPDNEDAKFNKELLERVLDREESTKAGPGLGYSPGTVEKGF